MKKFAVLLAVFLLPLITFGQDIPLNDGNGVISSLTNAINTLIPFIIGIAIFIFIVGLLRYVNAGGDEEKTKAARNTIIWGLIIIFVMFSVVGIINILNRTFGLQGGTFSPEDTPQIPTP